MKLATLDFRHIERKLGGLAEGDRKAVSESLKQLLPFEIGTA